MASSFKLICLISLMLLLSCGKRGGLAPSSVDSTTSEGTCAGTVVGGFCWYYGNDGQSCDDVCAVHGGYNEATATFAGSSGTDNNCNNVLDAIGALSAGLEGSPFCGTGVGCALDVANSIRTRCFNPVTISSGSNGFARRACACND